MYVYLFTESVILNMLCWLSNNYQMFGKVKREGGNKMISTKYRTSYKNALDITVVSINEKGKN